MSDSSEIKEWLSDSITKSFIDFLNVRCEQLKDWVVASETMEDFIFRKGCYQEATDILKSLEEVTWI